MRILATDGKGRTMMGRRYRVTIVRNGVFFRTVGDYATSEEAQEAVTLELRRPHNPEYWVQTHDYTPHPMADVTRVVGR